jgi:hypothetical protein
LSAPDSAKRSASLVRRLWVDASGGHKHPGLVIAWRRGDDRWEAYVAVARDGSVLITWEQASRLHPVVDDGWQLPPRDE